MFIGADQHPNVRQQFSLVAMNAKKKNREVEFAAGGVIKNQLEVKVTEEMPDVYKRQGGSYSTDGVLKDEGIHREWGALVAGNDISQAPFVIEEAKRLLRGKSGELNVVKDAFRRAYQSCRNEAITDSLLGTFEMSIDEFKKKGSKQLHPEVFADISIRMRSFSLGCTFMVYGFDDNVKPHVFTIANPGRVESFDKPGFWAIGAGARSSLSTLSVLRQHPDRCSVEQTIYNLSLIHI